MAVDHQVDHIEGKAQPTEPSRICKTRKTTLRYYGRCYCRIFLKPLHDEKT